MVKFKVPIKDILGKAYYRYELVSSHYNTTTTETNITITCTVKNIFGNPVANKELTLYHQNSIQGTATTNANGIATWTVGNLGVGNQIFWVEDATIIIHINGWETINVNSYTNLIVNKTQRIAMFQYYRTGYNVTSANSEITVTTGLIPSDYRPPVAVNLASYNVTLVGRITNNGDFQIMSSTTGSKSLNFYAFWHY